MFRMLHQCVPTPIIEKSLSWLMRKPTFLSPSLWALCLVSAAVDAQTEGGSDILAGRVTDLTGKPVADAQVGVTSVASHVTRTTTTDADGRYRIYFPETAAQYFLQVKRLGFSPVQRTVARRTREPEQMTIDLELGGAPLALSMVEIEGGSDAPHASSSGEMLAMDISIPNPIAEIVAMKDTLHLSAVQIVRLNDVADTLQARNTRIYKNIRTLLSKSRQAGDATQMAGSVALMFEEASTNSGLAIAAAEKLLRPEQWEIVPRRIRERPEASNTTAKQ
jgi:hypothetical protein